MDLNFMGVFGELPWGLAGEDTDPRVSWMGHSLSV